MSRLVEWVESSIAEKRGRLDPLGLQTRMGRTNSTHFYSDPRRAAG